jgi:hypothetical protein
MQIIEPTHEGFLVRSNCYCDRNLCHRFLFFQQRLLYGAIRPGTEHILALSWREGTVNLTRLGRTEA